MEVYFRGKMMSLFLGMLFILSTFNSTRKPIYKLTCASILTLGCLAFRDTVYNVFCRNQPIS